MSKFLIKISIILLPAILIAIAIEVLLRNIPNDYSLKRMYIEEHADEIQTLVLGSSHALYGLNPEYFTDNCFNASYVGQTLDCDEAILKKYMHKLSNLKTVIVPTSYFSFVLKLNEGEESWRTKNYVLYYMVDISNSIYDYTEIFSNNFEVNIDRLISYYVKNKSAITCNENGCAISYDFADDKELEKTGIASAKRHTAKDYSFVKDNVNALISIVELCNKNNIRVLLYMSPAHKNYRKNLNKEQLLLTYYITNRISKKYHCTFIDFFENKSFDKKDYCDSDHLNYIGQKKLSLMLNDEVEKKAINLNIPE